MAVLTDKDRELVANLAVPQEARVLTFNERHALRSLLVYVYDLEQEKSWKSPYREAISALERLDTQFMGNPA